MTGLFVLVIGFGGIIVFQLSKIRASLEEKS